MGQMNSAVSIFYGAFMSQAIVVFRLRGSIVFMGFVLGKFECILKVWFSVS